jgi:hypothetical protein
LSSGHLRAHGVGRGERVRAGPLENADRRRGLAAELAVDRVVARREFDARHVAHARDAAVRARLDHDVAERRFIREPALRVDRVLKCGRAFRHRLRADDARGDLHILLLDRLHHVLRRELARGDLCSGSSQTRIEYSRAPKTLMSPDPIEPRELVADLQQRVIAREDRIERAVGRDEVHDHRDVGRLLFRRDADALHIGRQRGMAMATRFCTEHLRGIEIGAELEGDVEQQVPVARALRRHVEHVLDAIDLLLDRRRHRSPRPPSRSRRGSSPVTWIVGGAISGYCAIGSVHSAMAPTSVITIEMTPAKIGRSMKKWLKFI